MHSNAARIRCKQLRILAPLLRVKRRNTEVRIEDRLLTSRRCPYPIHHGPGMAERDVGAFRKRSRHVDQDRLRRTHFADRLNGLGLIDAAGLDIEDNHAGPLVAHGQRQQLLQRSQDIHVLTGRNPIRDAKAGRLQIGGNGIDHVTGVGNDARTTLAERLRRRVTTHRPNPDLVMHVYHAQGVAAQDVDTFGIG